MVTSLFAITFGTVFTLVSKFLHEQGRWPGQLAECGERRLTTLLLPVAGRAPSGR